MMDLLCNERDGQPKRSISGANGVFYTQSFRAANARRVWAFSGEAMLLFIGRP